MAKSKDKTGAPRTVKDAVAVPPVRPSSDSLIDHWFVLAGGPEKVAKMLMDEYLAASKGSMVRQRILEIIFRNLRAGEGKGLREDLGGLAQEDLDRLIDDRDKRIRATLDPGAANGPPGPV